MKNLEEKEKIFDEINKIKEEIWETKDYISSDHCRKCSEMYTKLFRLEQHLSGLQRKLDNECT
jgi:formylmethanofuran dehydrogenase subunit E